MAARRKKSKKPSGSSSGPPPELVVFVDECLGRYAVPEALRAAGLTVVCHHTLFLEGTDDAEWLRQLATHPDWLIFTKDGQIRRRPLEALAFRKAGLRVFALTSANRSGLEQAHAFVRALPKIRRLASRRGPFIAKVLSGGAVRVLQSR
jgi:PIN like domain